MVWRVEWGCLAVCQIAISNGCSKEATNYISGEQIVLLQQCRLIQQNVKKLHDF